METGTAASSGDREIVLASGRQRAVVSTSGAALRRYFLLDSDGSESDVVWGYSGGANKIGGQGDVLIPFPSRIANARYTFEGETHQMEINDRQGPNAIHGFLREAVWEVRREEPAVARFYTSIRPEPFAFRGYPFSLDVELEYVLEGSRLSCEFRISNPGNRPAPVGVGYHPYFTVGTAAIDDAEVVIPADRYLEFEPTLVPTGKLIDVEGTPLDFRTSRLIGSTSLDHCFTGLIRDADGIARAVLRNPGTGRSVEVWMDAAFRYLVLFTGDTLPEAGRRKALAIEPMTCSTDAFNRPDWGLVVLAPSGAFRGTFGIACKE